MEANQITSFQIKKYIYYNSFNSLNFLYMCIAKSWTDIGHQIYSYQFNNIFLILWKHFYMQPLMCIKSTKFAPFFYKDILHVLYFMITKKLLEIKPGQHFRLQYFAKSTICSLNKSLDSFFFLNGLWCSYTVSEK